MYFILFIFFTYFFLLLFEFSDLPAHSVCDLTKKLKYKFINFLWISSSIYLIYVFFLTLYKQQHIVTDMKSQDLKRASFLRSHTFFSIKSCCWKETLAMF